MERTLILERSTWKLLARVDAYKSSRAAGIAPREVTLNTILGAILAHIRTLTDPTRLASDKPGHGLTDTTTSGEIASSVAQPAWKEWADRATAVFHEATTHGVKPRVETFSSMLAYLRPPTDQEVQLAAKYGANRSQDWSLTNQTFMKMRRHTTQPRR